MKLQVGIFFLQVCGLIPNPLPPPNVYFLALFFNHTLSLSLCVVVPWLCDDNWAKPWPSPPPLVYYTPGFRPPFFRGTKRYPDARLFFFFFFFFSSMLCVCLNSLSAEEKIEQEFNISSVTVSLCHCVTQSLSVCHCHCVTVCVCLC